MPVRKQHRVKPRVRRRRSKAPTVRHDHAALTIFGVLVLLGAIPFVLSSRSNAQAGTSTNSSVSASSDTIPPANVNNLTADQPVVPPITPPCGPVSLYPTINAMGVTIDVPVAGADHATLRYRQSGAASWTAGQDAVAISTGAIKGSIFWLSPATSYDVEVTSRNVSGAALTVNQCTVSTQSDVLNSPIVHVINVSASAAPGGNGSIGSPYQTIQAGVNAAQPGDEVLIQAGAYHEEVTPPRSGLPGQFIKIIGQPGAVIDGADPTIENSGTTWTADGGNVYHTVLPSNYPNTNNLAQDPAWRNTDHFYTFDNLTALQNGTDHHGDPMAEGWFFDPNTKTFYVRSLTNPTGATWRIRRNYHGIFLTNVSYIWIEGIAFRYQPQGVYIRSGSNNVIRNNDFQDEVAVLQDTALGPDSANNRIELNHMADAPVADWGYSAVKGTAMEAAAIEMWQGTGTIVRDNRIENFHDGIFGSADGEVDVYRNVVRHLSDDGLEPDGAGVNYRAWGNGIDDTLSAISMAPVDVGPMWIINNRFTQFTGRGFKIGGGVSGVAFVYQNTLWTNDATGPEVGAFGTQQVTTDTDRIVFRNNIFDTVGHAIRWTAPMPGVDMDYDNVHSTSPTSPYVWNATNYTALSSICTNFGQECHGFQTSPQLVDPTHGSFGLSAGSPDVDSGVRLPGINDVFAGAAPDKGYLEVGQTEIHW